MSLAQISSAGVSIWLDDLSRERMTRGGKASFLPDLIENSHIVGVTTNPAIFSAAIANSDLYKVDVASKHREGKNAEEIITSLTTSDVKAACNLFLPRYESSNGVDGRVSIEVDPRLATITDETIAQAHQLWELVDMPNVLIKVPATKEGIPAIRSLIANGISVNVTIIFSVNRYREVLEAFIVGLEDRLAKNLPISNIHSVASFFISRVDTEIDARLDALKGAGAPVAGLRGRAALANARLAYEHFLEVARSPRWLRLAEKGGNIQRPLWASTGVKDPNYESTMYVLELVAEQTVNTMPEATLLAVKESNKFAGNAILGRFDESREVLRELKKIGIDIEEVANKLEQEGIDKFIKPWIELIEVVKKAAA